MVTYLILFDLIMSCLVIDYWSSFYFILLSYMCVEFTYLSTCTFFPGRLSRMTESATSEFPHIYNANEWGEFPPVTKRVCFKPNTTRVIRLHKMSWGINSQGKANLQVVLLFMSSQHNVHASLSTIIKR